ncbi:cyclic 2,3-diphosphoglycerate-synthetase [Rubrobacter xylanophilus DSM 9941]|uniref:Cyclic 2,3-diphosphoglycerate synthetase n=1 Tax=Rubrobacter xylanophilus (strain DSM 9941 / JCM 11954 / NBRC 16129 / PRD-1) TaxID=266117 RepID=CPGS_RUBXD|nr:cyclic 2,3-phosphoglycerate synthetase [Rubrobacter xylanophilus]Q1AVG0.1 RecName: Full=Cyclic 2,3-diphosphoglycerate synthetase; Short=cDPGS [Rubrobacter xylanophilus DSM 9941]ABG04618.1 cyclic 2,3-diphosphoglycerate-synthetase [Rubrobacter xylanophilus DSM 9941]
MRTLFLIDGEHYPPVVLDAMRRVREQLGAKGVAAAFLGGTEKIGEGADYGLPLVAAEDPVSAVRQALERYGVEAVVDLSDEPVVGYRERMRIASLALAAGARYVGSDFELRPPEMRRVPGKPSLAVIGTGKRVGKTAVTGYLARLLDREGFRPAVVSMGRGGPPEPEVLEGRRLEVGSDYLLRALERGAHAASDYYETAALSRVTTVGCRRCGGGLAGEPFVSNVLEGARIAAGLDTGITVFDGSGAAIPPVEVDRRVLVAGAHQDPEYVAGYLGAYRLLISDLLVLTMAEEPMAPPGRVEELVRRVREVRPDLPVIPAVFRPRPVGEVRGMRVAYVSTAPPAVLKRLAGHLEEGYGCEVVAVSGNLSNRSKLAEDLEGMPGVDAYLTEIKAAAVDVVTRRGAEEGRRVIYCDNDPVAEGLDGALLRLARAAGRGRSGDRGV